MKPTRHSNVASFLVPIFFPANASMKRSCGISRMRQLWDEWQVQ